MDAVDRIERSENEVAYLDELGRELTAAVQKDVYKFAVRCAYRLQRRGTRVDPDLAKNLVADAISDTANGDRRWRPEHCTLTQHLRGVVRSQASIIADHNQRFPKVEVANDDEDGAGVTLASPGAHPEVTMMRELARRVLSPLYAAANDNDDPHVVRVLKACASSPSG